MRISPSFAVLALVVLPTAACDETGLSSIDAGGFQLLPPSGVLTPANGGAGFSSGPSAGPFGSATDGGGLDGSLSSTAGIPSIVLPSDDAGSAGPPPMSQADLVTLASGQTCPWGMAIDDTSVYWTTCGDPTGGNVLKVSKAGGEVVALGSGDRLSGIAVANGSVYWVAGTSDASSGAIMEIPVGGGAMTTLASMSGDPAHIAADSSCIYWSEIMAGTVMKVPITGGEATTIALAETPFWIALGETDVFWMGQGVMKAPKAGGTATALTPSSFLTLLPAGLAVDATNVYFTSGSPGSMSAVSTVFVQGGAITPITSGAQSSIPGPIAIDDTRAYWADDGSNAVYAVPLSGGTPTTLAIDQNNVVAITVDGSAVYWLVNPNSSTGQGAVMKLSLTAF